MNFLPFLSKLKGLYACLFFLLLFAAVGAIVSIRVYAVPTYSLNDASGFNLRLDGAHSIAAGDGIGWRDPLIVDINGNGKADLITTDFRSDISSTDCGSIYILFDELIENKPLGTTYDLLSSSNYSLRIDGATTNQIGFYLRYADINGDGYKDLLTHGLNNGSGIYIVSGQKISAYSGTGNTLLMTDPGAFLYRLTGVTGNLPPFEIIDINLDGVVEVLAGDRGTDFNATNSGSIYVVNGLTIRGLADGTTTSMASSSFYNVRIDGHVGTPSGGLFGVIHPMALDSDPEPELLVQNNFSAGGGSFFIVDDNQFDLSTTGNILSLASSSDYSLRIDNITGNTFLNAQFGRAYFDLDWDRDSLNDLAFGTTSAGSITHIFVTGNKISPYISTTGNVISLDDTSLYDFYFQPMPRIFSNIQSFDWRNVGVSDFTLTSQNNDSDPTDLNRMWVLPSGFANNISGEQAYTGFLDDNAILKFTAAPPAQGLYHHFHTGDANGDNKIDFLFSAPRSDYNSRNNSGSVWVIFNYPHSVALNEPASFYFLSTVNLTGNIDAQVSVTKVAGVEYSVGSNSLNSVWKPCVPVDGSFDSKDEDYKCVVTGLSSGNKTVYIRSYDEMGSYTAQSEYAVANFIVTFPVVEEEPVIEETEEPSEETPTIPDEPDRDNGVVDLPETNQLNILEEPSFVYFVFSTVIFGELLFIALDAMTGIGMIFKRIGILIGVIIPKKRRYWGVIFDEVESKGVPFAVVNLLENNVVIQNTVSDLEGRYGFLVDKVGEYFLEIKAGGFETYYGKVSMKSSNLEIIGDIQLKRSDKKVNLFNRIRFFARREFYTFINILWTCTAFAGLIISIDALRHNPIFINYLIILLYVVLIIINLLVILAIRKSYIGSVKELDTLKGIPNAAVRFFTKDRQVLVWLTNKEGALKVNLVPGNYIVMVNKNGYEQKEDGHIMINRKGFMNNDIKMKKLGVGSDVAENPFA